MGLPKGRTNNPSGRTVGTKNEKTLQWEALGESITGCHAENFNKIIKDFMQSGDPDLMQVGAQLYLQACEYFKPKQARVSHIGEADASPINIIIQDGL
jgi:hypothetical protein